MICVLNLDDSLPGRQHALRVIAGVRPCSKTWSADDENNNIGEGIKFNIHIGKYTKYAAMFTHQANSIDECKLHSSAFPTTRFTHGSIPGVDTIAFNGPMVGNAIL